MSKENFAWQFARLQAALAADMAAVKADPMPRIAQLHRRLAELEGVLYDVEYALSPDYVFTAAHEIGIQPVDIRGEALFRCDKALAVIREFRRPKQHSTGAKP